MFSLEGELLLRSHAAPNGALASQDGFSDVVAEGVRWRAFRRIDADNRLVIVVAHRLEEREAMVRGFALRLLLPFAIGLPLIGLALWLAVARGLAPLERLAAEVRGREAGHLAPLEAHAAPAEIEPLLAALNQLFTRVERSFENERRFTGDAAHELRTPLAALRTHAEVALSTASEERRRRSLEQVVEGVDRAARLVEQMLTLARLEAAQEGYGTTLDLATAAGEALESLRAAAASRKVQVRFYVPTGGVAVRGDAAMLRALVRNLVENAIRHAPEGGVATVTVSRAGSDATLVVEDSGAGVPPELRERIFDRHFRAPGESGGAAGLGLSIARRVAQLHGGTIAAREGVKLPGLRIEVRLPADHKDPLRRGDQSGLVTPPLQESTT